METIGNQIKYLREKKGLLLREVAASTDIDQALLCKIEKGERKPTRDQVIKFSKFFKIETKIFLAIWLSEKIVYSIINEDVACEALKIAEESLVEYKSQKRVE